MIKEIGEKTAKTAIEVAQNEAILSTASGLIGKLFPYFGITKAAVDMYIEDIKKSDLPEEIKVFKILDVKKEFKRIKNQKAIVNVAVNNTNQKKDLSENLGVNEEWLNRFMESAGFVSSEEIQLIWGKILANEFDYPGSTPPNMIRVLTEITPGLARAFRTICSMTIFLFPLNENGDVMERIRSIYVPYKNNYEWFTRNGLDFRTLNELEALGVIRFDSAGGYISKEYSNQQILICVGDIIYVVNKYKQDRFPMGNVMLTLAGEALQKITDPIEIDGYNELIKRYMLGKGVSFADKHDYVSEVVGNTLNISRK